MLDAEPLQDREYAQALDRAKRLLARRPRSRRELRERLAAAGYEEPTIDRVERRLGNLGLLDDAALARNWIEGEAMRRGLARESIEQRLRARGIDPEAAAEAVGEVVAEAQQTELEQAIEVARRRAGAYRGLAGGVAQRRLAGFLARRGFDDEVVAGACREVLEDPE